MAWNHLLFTVLTAALLFLSKVPAPLIVAAARAAGRAWDIRFSRPVD